mmetsp:Transcript_1431/g.3862  ORF Transcript_1431/g.3862 Transcript_1431/m.3862 type:complete len:109 (+) Transcript_1431:957-1283(+)
MTASSSVVVGWCTWKRYRGSLDPSYLFVWRLKDRLVIPRVKAFINSDFVKTKIQDDIIRVVIETYIGRLSTSLRISYIKHHPIRRVETDSFKKMVSGHVESLKFIEID